MYGLVAWRELLKKGKAQRQGDMNSVLLVVLAASLISSADVGLGVVQEGGLGPVYSRVTATSHP